LAGTTRIEQGKNIPANTQMDNINQRNNAVLSQTTTDSVDTLIYGDMKIGNLAIGQTLESIQSKFGNPELKTIAHGNGDPQWEYNKPCWGSGSIRVTSQQILSRFVGFNI